jgi:diadenosine tetraphosphate (Ap4A) HIT family hydrolase
MIVNPSPPGWLLLFFRENVTGVRPFTQELWQDLREVTRKIRPDWDLSAPGLRENWEGDKTLHFPYKARK